jgi:hypothetical protein
MVSGKEKNMGLDVSGNPAVLPGEPDFNLPID